MSLPTIRTDTYPWTKITALIFAHQTFIDRVFLEQLIGQDIVGFRAPRFSLVPRSSWAVDVLKDIGFTYSSSVMPTTLALYGYPGVPTQPFAWDNGLIEFPVPLVSLGGRKIPYLGGIYLYLSPKWLTDRWMSDCRAEEVLWTYMHPYDVEQAQLI